MTEHTTPHGGTTRRTVLRAAGAAWAAPVVLAATATPAAAASPNKTDKLATYNKYNPKIGSNKRQIRLDTAQIWYDPNAWGVNQYPSKATVHWKVYVVDQSNNVVYTYLDGTVEINAYNNSQIYNKYSNTLPAGTYRVVSEIVSVTYSPNPVNGFTFATSGSKAETTITI